jgi:hypothetical protein
VRLGEYLGFIWCRFRHCGSVAPPVYSAFTIDQGGQTHQGWRSFRFTNGQLEQTVFYRHHARHDDQTYGMAAGEYAWGPDMAVVDAAAKRLLEQLVADAQRDGAQPFDAGIH